MAVVAVAVAAVAVEAAEVEEGRLKGFGKGMKSSLRIVEIEVGRIDPLRLARWP